MKLKTILLSALAALTLASCSKDSDNGVGTVNNGTPTVMKITVNHSEATTRATPPEAVEKTIEHVNLYIFDATNVLEAEVAFDANATSKIFPITTGDKNIYALVNMANQLPVVTEGATTLAELKNQTSSALVEIDPVSTANKFWMTTVDDSNKANLVKATTEEVTGGTKNNINIKVGRASSKVGVEFSAIDPSQQPASGKLTDVRYKMHNNPKQMYLIPSFDNSGYYKTPFYNAATVDGSKYFHDAAGAYKVTGMTSGKYTEPSYVMENSNMTPKEGNSTFIMVRGIYKFNSDFMGYDSNGENPMAMDQYTTFWRAYNTTTKTYGGKIYYQIPTQTAMDEEGVFNKAAEYEDGKTYYGMWLKNNDADEKNLYTVKRNTFWHVDITSVSDIGSFTDGEEGSVVDPERPLGTPTEMKATIVVLDWEDINQSGGI